MREILFRAYEKNVKRMLPVVSVDYNNNRIWSIRVDNMGVNGDGVMCNTTYRDGYEELGLESLVLMQYTGLKDKNGTRVYEGDICVHSDKDNYPRPFSIEWIEDYACFAFVDKVDFNKKYYFVKEDMKDLEVVGNIHDNRNLLK